MDGLQPRDAALRCCGLIEMSNPSLSAPQLIEYAWWLKDATLMAAVTSSCQNNTNKKDFEI